ncbi:hypothetical protein F2Q68_00043798 [Brassica cretica]|uniref:Uncharacterized protein n=1 Tax=Brassica cretica TaxID=69181 RepID=A0A8S9LLH4_BRACR|nr:hypothetical protein F2Q68_00043798 [Brassica cretica]
MATNGGEMDGAEGGFGGGAWWGAPDDDGGDMDEAEGGFGGGAWWGAPDDGPINWGKLPN